MKLAVSLESTVLILQISMQFLYGFKLAGFLGKTTGRMKQKWSHTHTHDMVHENFAMMPYSYLIESTGTKRDFLVYEKG